MRTYTSSRAKRKRFYRKSGFHVFLLISGRHGESIQSSIKLRETLRQITQKRLRRTDLRLGETVYVLVFYNISFSWLFSLNGLEYFFFYGVTVKAIYTAIFIKRALSYLLSGSSNPTIMALK